MNFLFTIILNFLVLFCQLDVFDEQVFMRNMC
jgi:hypothetical protein